MENNKKLEWFVFLHDWNTNEIRQYNVFNSARFYDGLLRIKKSMKKKPLDLDDFSKELNSIAMWSFWAKCEYEIIITNLSCTIDNTEIRRLQDVDENSRVEYVNLKCHKKVDIYEQLKLNWDKFASYIFENLDKIKPIKDK